MEQCFNINSIWSYILVFGINSIAFSIYSIWSYIFAVAPYGVKYFSINFIWSFILVLC